MRNKVRVLSASLGLVLFGVTAVTAQDWKPLPSAQRCPWKWGAADVPLKLKGGTGSTVAPIAVK